MSNNCLLNRLLGLFLTCLYILNDFISRQHAEDHVGDKVLVLFIESLQLFVHFLTSKFDRAQDFLRAVPKSTAAQSADANAISPCVLPLDFYVLLLFEVILAAHVRTQDLGNIDAAVGVQVVLEEGDEHTRAERRRCCSACGRDTACRPRRVTRIFSRRACASPRFEQEQTSKYFCWRGLHASISQLLTFRSARSPEQHSS